MQNEVHAKWLVSQVTQVLNVLSEQWGRIQLSLHDPQTTGIAHRRS
jgi:hypothetical protein